MKTKYGTWTVGDFDETGGYDCMTAGISCGPATIDGSYYDQKHCEPLDEQSKTRMIAAAKLISAAPELYDACETMVMILERRTSQGDRLTGGEGQFLEAAKKAISKAQGR